MRQWDTGTINGGDTVFGSDHQRIGSIDYCEEDYCKIDTDSPGRDCYVPSSAIENVQAGAVILNVPSDQIGRQGWERPPERAARAGRRQVIRAEESENLPPTAEEEIGRTEPM